MQNVICPQCSLSQNLDANCSGCAGSLKVEGLILTRRLASPSSDVDESGTLYVANGQNDEYALVRVAAPVELKRLQREETVLRGLTLKGVPRVLFKKKTENKTCLAMSIPNWPTLREALDEGRRTNEGQARVFLRRALKTLAELEALSPPVHHRAMGPGALLVSPEQQVMLIDFAAATDTTSDTTNDLVVGDVEYAPPSSKSPAAKDLYGLGLAAAVMLSRQNPVALAQQELSSTMRVEPAFSAYLQRLLRADHEDTFESVADALAAFPSADVVAAPENKSRNLGVMAAAILGLVTVFGVAYFFSGNNRQAVVVTEPISDVAPEEPPIKADDKSGHLQVTSSPKGADVFINDVKMGKTPYAANVAKGTLHVRASAPGHHPDTFVIELTGDLKVHADLEKIQGGVGRKTPGKRRVSNAQKPTFTNSNAAVLRAIERAIRKQASSLKSCADDADRVKLHLELGGNGSVRGLEALGASTAQSTRCVQDVLKKKVNFPTPNGNKTISADVWVWLAPSFKVAAY